MGRRVLLEDIIRAVQARRREETILEHQVLQEGQPIILEVRAEDLHRAASARVHRAGDLHRAAPVRQAEVLRHRRQAEVRVEVDSAG